MGGMPDMSDILLKVEDVATSVGVAASTIRKYSKIIENHNYKFARNNQNALMYDSEEVAMFKNLVKFKKDMPLDEAVKLVLSDMPGMSETASTSDIAMQNMPSVSDIQAMVTAMSDMQAQLKQNEVQRIKQEEQFAEKMQDKLAEQAERIEREMTASFKSEFNKFKDSLEETLGELLPKEKKSWWQRFKGE